jgi:hypothetical protein
VESVRGERRKERCPVFAARAEAVDENERRSVGGTGLEVVDAVAIDFDIAGVDVLAPEFEADTLVRDADWVGVEGHTECDE